jgi:hypothetical protein
VRAARYFCPSDSPATEFSDLFSISYRRGRVKNERVECHAGEISHHYVDDKWWHKQEIL